MVQLSTLYILKVACFTWLANTWCAFECVFIVYYKSGNESWNWQFTVCKKNVMATLWERHAWFLPIIPSNSHLMCTIPLHLPLYPTALFNPWLLLFRCKSSHSIWLCSGLGTESKMEANSSSGWAHSNETLSRHLGSSRLWRNLSLSQRTGMCNDCIV